MVTHAPIMGGLSVSHSAKKFQRPMTKRRAYGQDAETALKKSSLGVRRRFDGMSKLMARAGKGMTSKLPQKGDRGGGDGSCSNREEDAKKEDEKPFERLRVWVSPNNGGEAKGLPPTL